MDVIPKTLIFVQVSHSPVHKTLLPDRGPDLKQLACSIRKATLDQLHGSLQSHALRNCDQQMEVIGHHNKCMKQELARRSVLKQGLAKQFCHAVGLKKIRLAVRSRCNKVG